MVHPESVVHSAVQFADGSVKAQLGVPDMRLPIQYALSYPRRLPLSGPRLDLFALGSLRFERPDLQRFRCLALAYDAAREGGLAPCVLNAANEVANLAFRQGRLGFPGVAEVIEETLQRLPNRREPVLADYFDTDAEARRVCAELIDARQWRHSPA